MKIEKKYKDKGPTPQKMKAMKLTSHTAAMHFVVQFSGDGVVPRERFGPGSQLFMRASAEQCLETFMAHGQVVENL